MNYPSKDSSPITITAIGFALGLLTLILSVAIPAQQLDQLETGRPESIDLDIVTARTWGISEAEWQRVQTIRAIRHGLVSDQITPLEVLGIFADNPDDRRRYAKLYAAQQRELLDRIAAFEADYLEEYAALNNRLSAGSRGRSKLVIEIDCDSTECRRQIAEAIAIAQNGAVDMYVIGSAGNDAAVRIWAATNQIPPDLVRRRQITLNHAKPDMKRGLHQ